MDRSRSDCSCPSGDRPTTRPCPRPRCSIERFRRRRAAMASQVALQLLLQPPFPPLQLHPPMPSQRAACRPACRRPRHCGAWAPRASQRGPDASCRQTPTPTRPRRTCAPRRVRPCRKARMRNTWRHNSLCCSSALSLLRPLPRPAVPLALALAPLRARCPRSTTWFHQTTPRFLLRAGAPWVPAAWPSFPPQLARLVRCVAVAPSRARRWAVMMAASCSPILFTLHNRRSCTRTHGRT